jgi:hypothetical protein
MIISLLLFIRKLWPTKIHPKISNNKAIPNKTKKMLNSGGNFLYQDLKFFCA